jgi:thymidylate kinase
VHEGGSGVRGLLKTLWFAAWALALAHARARNMATALRARGRGMVVVSDRFAQLQVPGITDGVLLEPWLAHRSLVLRGAAMLERKLIIAASSTPPDIVLMLQVNADTVLRRRPTTHPELLTRRLGAIRRIVFPPPTRTVTIDANQPLEQVLADAKRAVWEAI